MKDVVLPHMTFFGPIIFCGAVRGVLVLAYTLQVWLGLDGNSSEWPWTYMFLVLLMFLFVVDSAGRSLGLRAWLLREVHAVREGGADAGRPRCARP
jgi:uncharacterized RDD family membrane protein YckC